MAKDRTTRSTMPSLKERFSSPEMRHRADRLLATDPGFGRLRNALRVTLAAASAALVSLPLVAVGSSPIAPLFGAIVGLLAAMAVNDGEVKQRKITTLLLSSRPPPSRRRSARCSSP